MTWCQRRSQGAGAWGLCPPPPDFEDEEIKGDWLKGLKENNTI